MLFVNSIPTYDEQEQKLKILYASYFRYAYKIAYNVLKNEDMMPDICQEIFTAIWRGLDSIKLEDAQGTKALVATIAKHTAINHYNKQKKITPNLADVDDDVLAATVSAPGADPLEIVLSNDSVEYIYKQINSLGETYKAVLLLTYKNELKPEEIAKLLDVSVKTVYTKLSRGKEKLKEKLLAEERGIKNEKQGAKK